MGEEESVGEWEWRPSSRTFRVGTPLIGPKEARFARIQVSPTVDASARESEWVASARVDVPGVGEAKVPLRVADAQELASNLLNYLDMRNPTLADQVVANLEAWRAHRAKEVERAEAEQAAERAARATEYAKGVCGKVTVSEGGKVERLFVHWSDKDKRFALRTTNTPRGKLVAHASDLSRAAVAAALGKDVEKVVVSSWDAAGAYVRTG